MKGHLSIIFISYFSFIVVCHSLDLKDYKLEQLQVLFRHGDRTATNKDTYQNDPYEDTWRSYGYGKLTKIGKKREHKIGQMLRERYDTFLGEYRDEDVYAYSLDADLTKISLQLVLAGLYPPTPSTSWSESINWQPIPTHYEASDVSFLSATKSCPQYNVLHKKTANEPELLKKLEYHQDLFQRITNNTGVTVSTLSTAMPIYSNLRSALSLGLPLPSWCSQEDFRELEKINALAFKSMTHTEQLRRMIVGPLVEQFLKAFNVDTPMKKIYLYSGSIYHIATFIDAHNITGAPDIHDYGSALILEKLRGPDEQKYIRVYLWTGVSEKLLPLQVSHCQEICPLSEYEKIVQPILPNGASKICVSSKATCNKRRMRTTKDDDLVGLDMNDF